MLLSNKWGWEHGPEAVLRTRLRTEQVTESHTSRFKKQPYNEAVWMLL